MTEASHDAVIYRIGDEADATRTALAVTRLALLREASEIDRALIATIVSELAANLYRYAGRGVIRVCRHDQQGCVDIDVLATDNGPGIADIDRAMSDHFSTGGTLGLGLPGVRRMADHFWLRSSAHQGTQVCARKRIVGTPLRPGMAPAPAAFAAAGIPEQVKVPAPQTPQPWESGVSLRPCQGFLVSGDRTLCLPLEQGVLFGIIDASGHGPYADAIAAQLERLFMEKGTPYLEQLMHCFADALKGSIGAAAGLVYLNCTTGSFSYLGLGNTRILQMDSSRQTGSQSWHGVSREGVLGSSVRRSPPPLQTRHLQRGDLLLLSTDGIPERGCAALVQTLWTQSVDDIATAVVRTLGRSHDDASCLVVRWLG